MSQTVKNLPVMQETEVQSLGREDLLEKGMATHSSMLAWGISQTEEPGGLQSMGSQRVTNTITFTQAVSVFGGLAVCLRALDHLLGGQLWV